MSKLNVGDKCWVIVGGILCEGLVTEKFDNSCTVAFMKVVKGNATVDISLSYVYTNYFDVAPRK